MTYLAGLNPGSQINHSGTTFTGDLLPRLLHALRDPSSGQLLVRHARFEAATFSDTANFGGVAFADAWFDGAVFSGDAVFRGASFAGRAGFRRATFAGSAGFSKAVFSRAADFGRAEFARKALFDNALLADAEFGGATFSDDAWFGAAKFSRDARFDQATFAKADFRRAKFFGNAEFSGVAFSGKALFDGAAFSGGASLHRALFSGDAGFGGARFDGDAHFGRATFSRSADFRGVKFSGDAWFGRVTFSDGVCFSSAKLVGSARFDATAFSGKAAFNRAEFSGGARFVEARFSDNADFSEAEFTGEAAFRRAAFRRAAFSGGAVFGAATFSASALFSGASFESPSRLGPLTCQGKLDLSGAHFRGPVTIEAATAFFACMRTRWDSTATLGLRYATADLTDAVMEYPMSVATHPSAFTYDRRLVDESGLAGLDPTARITSLSGVDAAHLTLTDVDLSGCLLTGTFHLDQLRLEGRCAFAPAPTGVHRHGAFSTRWTQRRTLAEEHHWRASTGSTGWSPASPGASVQQPAALAPVYRQLRKSFEDAKNEPDAADFYYGEMEMRRHDGYRPRSERALLTLYWAVSGYGLRASRALAWLLGAMAATVRIMMLWGIPENAPLAMTTGRLTGRSISLTTENPTPANPSGPLGSRLTSQRWEKSLRIVVNSVVFRSSGQNLTTVGTYTERASRLIEPALLGIAVLAVRGRVKR
ncbi:pentapeptide repeat-containing protein [Streptomyces sp. NPDC059851]|uniref:pentapeptide repeat-containing protein n=1 Tax=Streptomyces sp. NPDC059851 TaxID=3346971 RepID=UPI00365A9EF2